jgi:hypothetical protein
VERGRVGGGGREGVKGGVDDALARGVFRLVDDGDKAGDDGLVPPPTVKSPLDESRRPLLQLAFCPEDQNVASLVQKAKGALMGEAVRAMSGTMRWPGLATATPPIVPACQEGWVVKMLTPPPPAESGLVASVFVVGSSFHTISGMYDLAELMMSVLDWASK